MLLSGYTKEIFRADCNHSFQSVHCIAHLNEDITEVLPYLNAVLGGFVYMSDPPAVTFKVHGRLIGVQGDRIAVNALKDEAEADRILNWMKEEINAAWEQRDQITPSHKSAPRPQIMPILKLLPQKAGCSACGQPSCLVFAKLAAEGVKGPDDCPPLAEDKKMALAEYLSGFEFD